MLHHPSMSDVERHGEQARDKRDSPSEYDPRRVQGRSISQLTPSCF